MTNSVLSQARSWRFNCQETENGLWRIASPVETEVWTLMEIEQEKRWLLSVRDVPQILLTQDEAKRFLQLRRYVFQE